MQILQKIQDSFPCTYMHVQVSTSYFKMLKHVSLYTTQFPIVGCGQMSLLMPKTHSTAQRGSNSLFNETHLFILFTRSSEAFTGICMFTRFLFHYLACNMSKTRASASSRVPNTEKQMKARGRRPSAFICFEVFGTRDEARSPSF